MKADIEINITQADQQVRLAYTQGMPWDVTVKDTLTDECVETTANNDEIAACLWILAQQDEGEESLSKALYQEAEKVMARLKQAKELSKTEVRFIP